MASLDEYRERLAAEPLTPNQLGAVHHEFERLGYGPADRAERLEVSATLAGYPGRLATTKDLTMGEAGRLVGALRSCRDRADLRAALLPVSLRYSWREIIADLAAAWHSLGTRR